MNHPACSTKDVKVAHLFGSIAYPDHLQAATICQRCPLVTTCKPGPDDLFADGTYGGRMYINGVVKPTAWTGKFGRPKAPEKARCVVCSTPFTRKSGNHVCCSEECTKQRRRRQPLQEAAADKAVRAADMKRRGMTDKQIAKQLNVTTRTVERYLATIRRNARALADQALTADDRRRMHNAFTRGERTPEVIAGERAYQRTRKRRAAEREAA